MNYLERVLHSLSDQDLASAVPGELSGRLERYIELVQEWNDFASLVSRRTERDELDLHLADSLSLIPFLHPQSGGVVLYDIGSGGGFPAIPLACACPTISVQLLERSTKKVSFLKKAVAALDLSNCTVSLGNFEQQNVADAVTVLTARAVEKPQALVPLILSRLPRGARFLCQSLDPRPFAADIPHLHVTKVCTPASVVPLPRGDLYLVENRDQRST